jgi:hypothetical protein
MLRTWSGVAGGGVPRRFWIEALIELISLTALLCFKVLDTEARILLLALLCIADLRDLISVSTWDRIGEREDGGRFVQYEKGLGVRPFTNS